MFPLCKKCKFNDTCIKQKGVCLINSSIRECKSVKLYLLRQNEYYIYIVDKLKEKLPECSEQEVLKLIN